MGALLPAALSVGGGLLGLFGGHKKETQDQQNNIELQRAQWDQMQRSRAARAQLVQSILGGLHAPNAVNFGGLTTPSPFPNLKTGGGGLLSGLGSFLSGAGIGLSNLPGKAKPAAGGPALLPPAPLGMPTFAPENMLGSDGTFNPDAMWK